MESDATPDASSASPADPVDPLASLSAPDLATWRATGQFPEPSDDESPAADSTPAEPAVQAASTDALSPAASEPATPPKKKAKGADARIQELLAERAAERQARERAERELEALRTRTPDVKPAAPSPAPERIPDHKRYLAMPDAPKLEAFDTLEEWAAAQAVFVADTRHAERQAAQQQQTQRHQAITALIQRDQTFSDQLKAAAASDPTFVTKVNPALFALKTAAQAQAEGERLTVRHAIAEELIDSPIAPQLLLHLTEHPDDYAALQAARSKDELKRLFGRLEGRLQRDAPALPTGSPAPKTITSAPTPGTFLGSRPAGPVDSVEAALKRGDTGAYLREANARDLAALRARK